ncbi:TPA: glycosyltransferase family 2 protein [Pseudomonas aeruginosa]|uniref:glycosyltransferase n=1 Tax=Pseudomonas TaxID=286 RepID=UPI001A2B98DD|nr:glycosyltransferase [Pseudomonas aeruginosa]MBH3536192.1 glycosyltransferase family 2 protein [Pseudomonas aeruginosa]MBX6553231.1 glycosyltransferase family 2 protein [Pseudomonas aeruginosa]MBX6585251.1 glycosyltransferase family 2 protein [Pseudomonas aeruginosa]MBX6615389.1 glycosyltransferase family 2 protein [Pseudomonas aeruginosa]MBX6878730.1 glycosyltransferase family 2 protein [Pseudomonas aeruginosa]
MHLSAPRRRSRIVCSRGTHLVGELSASARTAEVVIGICLHNQASKLPSALDSAMTQQIVQQGRGVVVILDDGSSDNWQSAVESLLSDPKLIVLTANCGSAAKARNALLDWVDEHLPAAAWVARLDADDRFACAEAVAAMVRAGERAKARFVLGSNHLELGGVPQPHSNIADSEWLHDTERLVQFIEAFCLGQADQELPSCNLLLRTRSGIRYPHTRSAEDHWLVARLLILEGEQGVILPYPVVSIYSLGGELTCANRRSDHWYRQRERLAQAARIWTESRRHRKSLLGVGQEGVVWREGEWVHKQFYPWAMSADDAARIEALVQDDEGPVPRAQWWQAEGGSWHCRYAWFESQPLPSRLPVETVKCFLLQLLTCGYVTGNVTRANFRVRSDGRLVCIDIGADISELTVSRFLDTAARLYSVGILGQADHDLARRDSTLRQHEALDTLPGFSAFFRELIEAAYPHVDVARYSSAFPPVRHESRVTLLIKACAQDADVLDAQARHIVSQLSYPAAFSRRILLLDTHSGPFLRQYASADLAGLVRVADSLLQDQVIDAVWMAPTDSGDIKTTYRRWFGRDDVAHSHTHAGAPLFAQLWAFDQLDTQLVLQCDIDILVGRRDWEHDFLDDMCRAIEAPGVVSVGFNIPQLTLAVKPYIGKPGEYPPEVRCGLLHVPRMQAMCPLPNGVVEGRFELMWHRSAQQAQASAAACSLRGGDSRTYYLHPQNADKNSGNLPHWRDLVAQGKEPPFQRGKWDLVADAGWKYPPREEPLVFLLKGRHTGIAKLRRSLASLALQREQRFGLIVIDDGSPADETWQIPMLLGDLRDRTTLIRRERRYGYIPNFLIAVEDICRDPETLIVTVDLDDALMSPDVASRLLAAQAAGADLINGAMFRPDKPLQEYPPSYSNARAQGGGNIWAHLRGFRKRLFDSLAPDYLRHDGAWLDEVTDYGIMLPLSELARQPFFIDDLYCYYHQREAYPADRKARQKMLLDWIFSLPPAQSRGTAEPG